MTTLTTYNALVTVPSFTTYHNLGPLPPTLLPSNCLNDLWNFQTSGLGMPSSWTYYTQGCAASTCCPSGEFYTEGWAWMTSYYSPGVCPSQYKSCPPPAFPTALSSVSGETIAFCCPTNYLCPEAPGFFQFCQSSVSTTSTQTLSVMDNLSDQKVLSTTVTANYVYLGAAYPIQVRTRSGDTFPTSTPTSTATSKATFSQPSTGNNTIDGSVSKNSQFISTGAVIGIAFAAFLIIALVLAGVLFYRYKSRKLFQHNQGGAIESDPLKKEQITVIDKSELPAQQHQDSSQPESEKLYSFAAQFSPGNRQLVELAS